MKFFRRLFLSLVLFLLLLVGTIAVGFYYINNKLTPINPENKNKVIFTINDGEPLVTTLKRLEDKKFIKDSRSARLYTIIKSAGKQVKPGNYQLSQSMPFEEMFNKFIKGDIYRLYVTIPEGFSIKKIAKRLSKYGFSEQNFLEHSKKVRSEAFDNIGFYTKEEVFKRASLEGYLFPDTYDIASFSKDDDISFIKSQLKRFDDVIYNGAWKKRPSNWNMSFHETLTLASIVELEAQKPEERAIIAGVFINRLHQGIPLGSDPTVEYALGWHQDENGLTLKDVQVSSPYNTYKNAGLPPGPIANPGLAAFEAVLNYDHTPYLYFVAKGDGSHVFTRTYAEHLHAQDLIVRGYASTTLSNHR